MGFFKKIFKAVESAVETVTKPIEQAIVRPVVEAVKDVGRDVDDLVNDAIPGGWGTVAAVTAVAVGAPPGTFSGGAGAGAGAGTAAGLGAADAVTAAEWFGGAGAATSPGAIFGSAAPSAGLIGGGAELASVGETMAPPPGPSTTFEFGYQPVTEVSPAPIIEATPVSTNPTRFPGVEVQPTYTPSPGSFQEALPSLGIETQATTAPYTALPGTFPAAVAATTGGLLSTPAAPSTISIQQALRGAQLANQLLSPQQVPTPNLLARAQEALAQQGAVDYSSLLGLLSQQAGGTGLLGTRFQPQPINLASLLG